MCFIAQKEINRLNNACLLSYLLEDKTSNSNIIWATDAYSSFGAEYGRSCPITVEKLTNGIFNLKSRSEKDQDEQSERTKSHAEVFTPMWVVEKMNDYIDSQWFEREFAFSEENVSFPKGKTWQDFVDSRRLEITCGEAPYLVTRYDASSGREIPLIKRVGILDRKLRVVSENTTEIEEWFCWALRSYQATYGYEFQGDNLLLARLNLLLTFEDYLQEKFGRFPTKKEYRKIVNVIVWNIWQMDGMTGLIPFCESNVDDLQMDLFATVTPNCQDAKKITCRFYDWRAKCSEEFNKLRSGV